MVRAIDEPILLVAGDQDDGLARDATEMFGWAKAPRKLAIVKSSAHGTPLLDDPAVSRIVLSFLAAHT